VSNNDSVNLVGAWNAGRRTRARLEAAGAIPANDEESGDKVAIQRFTLVSRGAPAAKRAKAQHGVLLAPPRVAAQLGNEVQVCRCSECDRSGLKRRMSGTRMCRRDTEAHPEYALLLLMNDRFEAECAQHSRPQPLVAEACCREKTAYFILGAGSTTVGYVAAEVKANRKVRRANESMGTDAGIDEANDDDIPTLLQIYVEPEFRRKGYAFEAMKMLMRDHQSMRVDAPSEQMKSLLERLGFAHTGTEDGEEGRPLAMFTRTLIFEDAA